jgi:hypothetical protein
MANNNTNNQQTRLRSFAESLQKHIDFVQEKITSCYPSESKPHCSEPEESTFRFRPNTTKPVNVSQVVNKEGKSVKQYDFDDVTNSLADPKLSQLLTSSETYQKFLDKKIRDVRYSDSLRLEAPTQIEERTCEPKMIPSVRKQLKLKKLRIAANTRKNHDKLKTRIENLRSAIQKKKETEKDQNVRRFISLELF